MVCMGNIYEVIEQYNLNKECKILIIVDDVIADRQRNKNNFKKQ